MSKPTIRRDRPTASVEWCTGGGAVPQKLAPAPRDRIEVAADELEQCQITLPSPPTCVGWHRVICDGCGQLVLVIPAGRLDNTVTMVCRGTSVKTTNPGPS